MLNLNVPHFSYMYWATLTKRYCHQAHHCQTNICLHNTANYSFSQNPRQIHTMSCKCTKSLLTLFPHCLILHTLFMRPWQLVRHCHTFHRYFCNCFVWVWSFAYYHGIVWVAYPYLYKVAKMCKYSENHFILDNTYLILSMAWIGKNI